MEGFLHPLTDVIGVDTHQAVFAAVVDPKDADVIWCFNGEPIEPGKDANIEISRDDGKINDVGPSRAGTYQVEVQTEAKPKSLARLLYKKEAKLLSSSQSMKVEEGASFSINVTVSPPEAPVCWYHDDKPVSEASITRNGDLSSVNLENVSRANAGAYFAIIKENDEFFSFEPIRIVQIQVQSLSIPSFGIADVTTSAGSIATLKCVLEDNLSANSVEWHKSSSLDVSWPNEQIFENDRVKTGSENGSTTDCKKFKLSSRGHSRSLTITDCYECDGGAYMVQIQDKNGQSCNDRLRIGYVKVGSPSPKDLLMLWAEEMKKCNEIMHSMAESQKIYEEKARIAEEKLEDWKKGNRKPQKTAKTNEKGQLVDESGKPVLDKSGNPVVAKTNEKGEIVDESGKPLLDESGEPILAPVDKNGQPVQVGTKDGRSPLYQEGRAPVPEPVIKKEKRADGKEILLGEGGKPLVDDSGRQILVDEDGREFVEGENGEPIFEVKSASLEAAKKEEKIREIAAAAVARSSGASSAYEGDGRGRASRRGPSIVGSAYGGAAYGGEPVHRQSAMERASKFGTIGRARSKSRGRRPSVGSPRKTCEVEEKVIAAAEADYPPPKIDPNLPEAEQKLLMLEYQVKLKDLINSRLQEEYNKLSSKFVTAMGEVCEWQYDRRQK
ncbi:Oidioi.mRNA.OKI2018_I69.XSR.g15360.t1.cds [Oikopleura dioica]|uniref:Oidioi.mRNA.OKI2018_I69.XSR.g15360.t1.cds n=1 Tax=Oikopleura dioica TaxID=34765 RepID=A0ABN7SCM1_OIKDI|nr:Oidioi.mRNA.OKI2018_I69.XSR.g15360.t1.cds [Oikopleura dioica]